MRYRKSRISTVVLVMLLPALAACGMSAEEQARQENARRQALQKTLADSIAEEREKDRRMREAARLQADERIAGDARLNESDASMRSADAAAQAARDGAADAIRRHTEKLAQSTTDPTSLQVRNVSLSPNGAGMCAEFNARDKTGSLAGFKRVVVTDARVAPEEPPTHDTLTQFLLFQLAARDTGCFPDVHNVRILQ